LRNLLERNAQAYPEREVVTFQSGERWTAAAALAEARSAADVLRSYGIGYLDVVAVRLPNGPEYLRAWWGSQLLGAVFAPMNLGWSGRLLTHIVSIMDPKLIVCAGEPAGDSGLFPGRTLVPAHELTEGDRGFAGAARRPRLSDLYRLMATSGTTGPSKVWATTNMQAQTNGTYVEAAGLTGQDRFLVDLPLFHNAAMGAVSACQVTGTPVSLRQKPSLSRYLDVARETGATMAYLVGSMAAKLMSTPPSESDRDHSLRALHASPMPPDIHEFCQRFGIGQIISGYGTTEAGGVIASGGGGIPVPRSCGKPEPGFEIRLVDEAGRDVPDGVPGECLVRAEDPGLRLGYYVGDPVATETIWRAGWLHTGDLLRRDENGVYYFVDKAKDALRRRGENISSWEVESEVREYPGISGAAVVAAPADEGEGDEVKVWLVPAPGVQLDVQDLADFLSQRMAPYMVPRFYELTEELPVTTTMRVQKNVLRERGNGPRTWDREKRAYCPGAGQ
jgi:crotonobetaine/carnitine-CoA ligase